MTSRTRALATSLVAGLTATTLTGCLISYDAVAPSVAFDNNSARDVVVVVERADGEFSTFVPAQREDSFVLKECQGIAIRVETESGEVLGKVDEHACPDWVLTINEDGTLDYSEQ